MHGHIVIVILGFLVIFTDAASTKRDPQNQWRPGKKDDTNLLESRLEDDSDYNLIPSDVNEWNLDDATSQILGDQIENNYKSPPLTPGNFPRPGRKRSNPAVFDYNKYPAADVQSQATEDGIPPFVRPGRKRRSLIA